MLLTVATLFAISPAVLAGPIGNSPLSLINPSSPDTFTSPLYGKRSNRIVVRDSGWGGIPLSSNPLRSIGPGRVRKRAAEGDAIQPPKPPGYHGWPERYQKAHDGAEEEWRDAIARHPEDYTKLQTLDEEGTKIRQAHHKWVDDRWEAINNAVDGKLTEDEKESFHGRSRKIEDDTNALQRARTANPLHETRVKLDSKLSAAGWAIPDPSIHNSPLRIELRRW